MSQAVELSQDGAVAVITLNRPETLNAISGEEVVEGLLAVLAQIEADQSIGVAILTGRGRAFSSGGDVKAMQERRGMFAGDGAQLRNGYRDGVQRITRALTRIEVPLIAAVNGPAYGAGCDLALFCDLRIAAEEAVFAQSFVRLGIIAGDGGAWALQRVLGRARAYEMALTGRPIDAATALEWGLVNRVVPAQELLASAHELAEQIVANPLSAVRMTKQLMRQAEKMDLDGVLEYSAALQAVAHETDEHREALAALIEKRAPRSKGY